jgi:hypothetical protein
VFTVDSLDRCSPACRSINVNQYRIECHGSRGHRESAGDTRQEPLHDDVFVHSDAAPHFDAARFPALGFTGFRRFSEK